jgi:hypothetical protein
MDRDQLILAVSSFMETESHKLVIDESGNPILNRESWERITRALMLLDFPKDSEKKDLPLIEPEKNSSPLIEIDRGKTQILLYDIYEFAFTSFYPNIIINQDFSFQDFDAYKFIVKNRGEMKQRLSPRGYYVLKSWINFYYGMKGKNNSDFTETVAGTGRTLMKRLVNALGDSEIHADTDTIYFKGKEKLEKLKSYADYLGYPYEIEHFEAGIFFGNKKLILFKDLNSVIFRGIRNKIFTI